MVRNQHRLSLSVTVTLSSTVVKPYNCKHLYFTEYIISMDNPVHLHVMTIPLSYALFYVNVLKPDAKEALRKHVMPIKRVHFYKPTNHCTLAKIRRCQIGRRNIT